MHHGDAEARRRDFNSKSLEELKGRQTESGRISFFRKFFL
jgi:hypothetical protein